MKLLLAAATATEIAPLISYLQQEWHQEQAFIFSRANAEIHLLLTGVGMVATAHSLTKKLLTQTFDFALQAGIGGAFNKAIPLGELVLVAREIFGDLGAEDHYNFIDVFELGFVQGDQFPFREKALCMPEQFPTGKINLPEVSGLSINMVSGSSFTALSRFEKYHCDVESMEGAAFHYVCLQEGIPFAQVRAISNYVEARDKTKWKIGKAVANLNDWLIQFAQTV